MNDFLDSFNSYIKSAQFSTIAFWAFPVCTFLLMWLSTTVGLKLFSKRKRLRTVFMINRAWIISSLITAALLIGLICYWWATNYFAENPLQLSLLISLIIAMSVPVIALLNLRNYYTSETLKEITIQPKTPTQLDETIIFTKRAFRKNKLFFLLPIAGFIMLLFYLGKGVNLIAIVYDNSQSMSDTSQGALPVHDMAIEALSETFDNLQENNEIILTTLEGLLETDPPTTWKTSMAVIMRARQMLDLKAGHVVSYNNPQQAKQGLNDLMSRECFGSPICESIWKTHMYIRESRANRQYREKLLIIITDGNDNLVRESLTTGKFFFDDESFAENFPPDKVFLIDFSRDNSSVFRQRFVNAGSDPYDVENNKQAYLDALDAALQSFKNNWFLIYWTILVFSILAIVGLLIQPKKII